MDAPKLASSLELVRWIGWAQMRAGEDWIRERELSHPQAFVLGYLVQNPGAIQRDIAEVSRTSAASVSSLLQGLERRGLVERRSEDGNERSKRVYPTPEGIELIAGFDAAMAAARTRLRPILMTSLAFIFGVLPLAVAAGAGAEMRQSLGTAVFAGMLGVTIFGLIFTPVFYVLARWPSRDARRVGLPAA